MKTARIRTKLLLLMLAVALPSTALVGALAYVGIKTVVTREKLEHLTSVRATKAHQVESYFDHVRSQAKTLSANGMVVEAVADFSAAYDALRDSTPAPAAENALRGFYRDVVWPQLDGHADETLRWQALLPEAGVSRQLQYRYIVQGRSPDGRKEVSEAAEDDSVYGRVHRRFHPTFRNFVKEFGYHDLFLIDTSGTIVYSVSKEVDFATSLVTGPYRDSNLAAAVAAVSDAPSTDAIRLIDFSSYTPSLGAPASFVATPVGDGSRRLGTLALQMPIEKIDEVMTDGRDWQAAGLGETGETYLVGPDFRMRSNSRFLLEDPQGYLSAIEDAGSSGSDVERIRRFGTTILLQEVRTQPVTAALDGGTATTITTDYRGEAVLSSYAPLDISDVNWAILAEIDALEAFAPLRAFTRNLVVGVLGMLLAAALLSWLFAGRFVRPIVRLEQAARRFAAGEQRVEVPVENGDELGRLSGSFNEMVGAIRQRTSQLENTLESLTHPFYVIDVDDYSIQLANSAARKLGISGESTCYALTHKRDTPCDGRDDPCPLVEVKKTRQPYRVEHIHYDAGGKATYAEVHGYPIFDDAGNVVQMIEYSLDITDKKKMELQLADAKNAAEAANRAKSTFLANMSHELRTPMNAIIGYSEMLAEDAEDQGLDTMIEDLGKIHAAGKHLLALINDILDLSKIEAGRMDVYLERFDLREMLDETVATVEPLLAKNVNRLARDFTPDLGTVRADLTKLRQCLFNLISNAAKFTHDGTITLAARRERRDDDDWIMLSVSDDGIGIPEDKLEQVFQEFSQADDSTTRNFGGTGLGLPISRRFCRMMGGDLSATSAPGAGSTFTIALPARVDALEAAKADVRAAPSPAAAQTAASRPVLIVDDDANARELLRRTLEAEGYPVVDASCGEEGLELARTNKPSLITLDVLMPGTDGWAVLRELKRDQELHDVPVVMVSIMGEKGLGFTLGAVEHLTKPVNRDALMRLVRQYATTGSGHALVVDDDESVRALFRRSLEADGWTVDEAVNGALALECVSEKTPDLVLLDLMMPVMDGFEFVLRFREREERQAIPIIVITAKDLDDNERRRLEGVVARVIQKGGLTRTQLLEHVRQLVAQNRQHESVRQGEKT